jgi:hypothetical protein
VSQERQRLLALSNTIDSEEAAARRQRAGASNGAAANGASWDATGAGPRQSEQGFDAVREVAGRRHISQVRRGRAGPRGTDTASAGLVG